MQRFRFTLYDAATDYALVLAHAPTGWASASVTLRRAARGGIQASYTEKMGFVKEGKALLDAAYEARGAEARVLLRVEEADVTRADTPLAWVPFYEGRVNLADKESDETAFTANVEQAGFRQALMAGLDTPLDLFSVAAVGPTGVPVGPPPTAARIGLHSRGLTRTLQATLPSVETRFITSALSFPDESVSVALLLGWDATGVGGVNELPGAVAGVTGFYQLTLAAPIPDPTAAFVAEELGDYRVEARIKGRLSVSRDTGGYPAGDFDEGTVTVLYKVGASAAVTLFTTTATGIGGAWNVFLDVPLDDVPTIAIGDAVTLFAVVTVRDLAHDIFGNVAPFSFGFEFEPDETAATPPATGTVPVSTLAITARTTFAPTAASGLLLYEALTRGVELLTGLPGAVRSSLLQRTDSTPALSTDGLWGLTWVGGGWQLREFPLDQKPFAPTLAALLTTFCAVAAAGWSITTDATGGQYLSVEPLDSYRPAPATPVIIFDAPADLVIAARPAAVYNEADVGFAAWETETINGGDETNARARYALPVTQTKALYSAVSPFIASGYSIELTRRKQYNTTPNEDTARDTAGFIILAVRDGGGLAAERTEHFDPAGFANIITPADAYNLRLLPALILRRHLPTLAIAVARQVAPVVRFAAGEGNTAARVQLLGDAPLVATDDAPTPAPPALPDSITGTAHANATTRRALLADPYQLIGLRAADGRYLLGSVDTLALDPAKNTVTFTLQRIN